MLNGLDLFSGIGGLTLALSPWVRPVAYCERDRYCTAVLMSRMRSGEIPSAPIWSDVTTLLPSMLPGHGAVDIIYGGFPCQDISVAGDGAGLEGKRSGLFFEIARLVGDIRPRFVFLENVPAIRTRGADVVTGRLAGLGYDCRWGVLSAFDMGAPHFRERWWLLAHRDSERRQRVPQSDLQPVFRLQAQSWDDVDGLRNDLPDADSSDIRIEQVCEHGRKEAPVFGEHGDEGAVAYTDGERLERKRRRPEQSRPTDGGWWATEPDVGRVVDELPFRVDRLRGLGNAVLPQCAREAFCRLAGIKNPGGP